jgi:HK97 family phage major capsid protein
MELNELLDDLKTSVATLTEAVANRDKGTVDQETVERIAAEVVERQRLATEAQNKAEQERSGYQPENDEDGLPAMQRRGKAMSTRDKLDHLLVRSASRGAAVFGKDVETVKRFHEASDNLQVLGAVLKNAAGPDGDFDVRETDYYREEFKPALRAVSAGGVATGAEYVPTLLSASLIDRINLQLRVAALFAQIDMPSNPYKLPALAVSRVRTGVLAEATADTGQAKAKAITAGTRNVQLSAVKFAARMLVSREAEEDSIVPILPWMLAELVDYSAADIEDAIINGDVTGPHQDTDTTTADDPRKFWNGLRKLTQAAAKADGGAANLSVALLRANRKNMGKYGINPGDLAHVLSINSYIQLLSDTSVMTLEKYGPAATILTGELGKADGVPLIVSEYQRTDLDATGVNSAVGGNNIKTAALTVNKRGFLQGQRRAMTVEVFRELYAESDQDLLMCSQRKAFQSLYPTSELTSSLTYNLAK